MAILRDALRQAFMPRHEYDLLREEERAWVRLRRPAAAVVAGVVGAAVMAAVCVSVGIVFPREGRGRPFCRDRGTRRPVDGVGGLRYRGAFYLTDEEAADYYWMVVFMPSLVIFLASVVYLMAGMVVAYSASTRHTCLKVVENNYCASQRGGVRCLAILNTIFAVIFGLLALFLGSSLLTLGSSCSVPLFWCYEITSWGLVILYGGTAFSLRRKAPTATDGGDYTGRLSGLEMFGSNIQVTPEMERRINEGFKAWMGSSLLSSDDEEDNLDDYLEVAQPILSNPMP